MQISWSITKGLLDPSTILGAFILLAIILVLAVVANRLLDRIFKRAQWVVGRLGRKVDDTVVRYVQRLKNILIYVTAFIIYASLVPGLRGLMGTLVAGAGITAIVIGFAARSSLSNLVSGISLTIYRPIRIGDKVTVDKEYGTVEDITLRHTIVRTWQHKRLIIPNEKMDKMTIVNYSLINPKMICKVEFGVSYDTDIDLARSLVLEEANNCPQRMPGEEAPWLRIINHGDFAIKMRLYVWVAKPDDAWLARFWLLERIKKRFDQEGIEIPFPYRTLVYKKDLPPPRKEEETEKAAA